MAKNDHIMRVSVNTAKGIVDLAIIKDGKSLASMEFTREQAEEHAKAVIKAIEMILGNRAPESPIIKPGDPGFRVN